MLWLSLSSSLSLPKFIGEIYAQHDCGLRPPYCIDSSLCLDMGFWEAPNAKRENEKGLGIPPSESEERKKKRMGRKKGLGDNRTFCFKQRNFSPEARNILHKEAR